MSIIEKAIEKLESQAKVAASAGQDPGRPGVAPQGVTATERAAPATSAAAKQLPDIINVPLDRLNSMGAVTPDRPRSRIAEEYRMIKRPLLANIEGKGAARVEHPNLIMVTSSLQGEGKTFTSINLAMSISMEEDRTVLLVDGDMAKASAGGLLGVPKDRPGLIDVLEREDIGIEDVLLHTNASRTCGSFRQACCTSVPRNCWPATPCAAWSRNCPAAIRTAWSYSTARRCCSPPKPACSRA
jgi:protein-tyrosine kinase